MTDYKVAMEGVTGTSTVVANLKPSSYSFRIYAFNEYFKGKAGPTANVDLNLASSSLSSNTFVDKASAKTEYIDEATYVETYITARIVYKGRFANVKEIIRKSDKRQYAAKCFMHELTQTANEWEAVEREIDVMRRIRHRNIVAYRGAVKMNNQLIIIMKLNGPHLLDYIIRLGYISEVLIQRFCKDLLLALEYLHSLQIAHLAIQPENLLTHISNVVRVLVIDFGSSRYNEETAVWNHGTIDFASPEQISHREVTTKSDMSFGIVLYTLLTGKIPFDDEYCEMIRLKILSNISTIDDTRNYRIYSEKIIAVLKSLIVPDASLLR
uniref:Protein kinase domain-containing protein n=1 Tax=Elaeophora elaphi TaxID=1147741 RepID=A0A0R3RT39_9BILA